MSEELKAMLQPGQNIRPNISTQQAKELILEHFGYMVTKIKELNSYDDNNFYVEATNEQSDVNKKFTLKVLNRMDSKKPAHVEAENATMIFLSSRGIVCPVPQLSLSGSYMPLVEVPAKSDAENNVAVDAVDQHIIRLLSFVEGSILYTVPITKTLLFDLGKYISHIEILLKELTHPGLDNHVSIWYMEQVPYLENFLYVLDNVPEKQNLVKSVLNEFKTKVQPNFYKLEKGIIHGDFNEQNIIVRLSENCSFSEEYSIQGVIDFGDIHKTYYVCELAVTLTYLMLECARTGEIDPIEGSGYALAGYTVYRNVPELELKMMRTLIASRLCQSVVYGLYTSLQDPNNEYVLTTQKRGWDFLFKIWNEITEEQLVSKWKEMMALNN